MPIIYEPAGKAREYSELAANLYTGCSHACIYCYCPSIMRRTLKDWSDSPHARTNILDQFERDAKKATPEMKEKELLLSFMSDCYQNSESAFLTRRILLICEKYNFKKVNILTKAGFRAVKDFDILQRNKGWKFGSTIIFRNEELREHWEPGAPSIQSRYEAIKIAKEKGIYTWISIEPVVDIEEAMKVISDMYNYCDFFKVGKLNHMKEVEDKINWHNFYLLVTEALKNKPNLIKKDLLKFA
jgi:DNA repair photolyase